MPPFKKILCAVDLDDNIAIALDVAEPIARQDDAQVVVLHVVPVVLRAEAIPLSAELYKSQVDAARWKLAELARTHLRGLKCEVVVELGDPAAIIIAMADQLAADLLVLTTHGRRGLSRLILGSVAETVMRRVSCPVMTARDSHADRLAVGHWMTAHPVTVSPDDNLSTVSERMHEGRFRTMPVISAGKLVGVITDRDVRANHSETNPIKVGKVMTREVLTVTPATSILDAARLLIERKIGALPVLKNGDLVGIISTADLLHAFVEMQ
jgi:nucleotide-binding universal stress UspA family protein